MLPVYSHTASEINYKCTTTVFFSGQDRTKCLRSRITIVIGVIFRQITALFQIVMFKWKIPQNEAGDNIVTSVVAWVLLTQGSVWLMG